MEYVFAAPWMKGDCSCILPGETELRRAAALVWMLLPPVLVLVGQAKADAASKQWREWLVSGLEEGWARVADAAIVRAASMGVPRPAPHVIASPRARLGLLGGGGVFSLSHPDRTVVPTEGDLCCWFYIDAVALDDCPNIQANLEPVIVRGCPRECLCSTGDERERGGCRA